MKQKKILTSLLLAVALICGGVVLPRENSYAAAASAYQIVASVSDDGILTAETQLASNGSLEPSEIELYYGDTKIDTQIANGDRVATFNLWSYVDAGTISVDYNVSQKFWLLANSLSGSYLADGIATYTFAQTQPLPTAPEKQGYTFVGWYYDADFATPYDGAAITSDTTLYAKYDINKYTVTFMVDGAVWQTMTVTYGTPLADVYKTMQYAFASLSAVAADTGDAVDIVAGDTIINAQLTVGAQRWMAIYNHFATNWYYYVAALAVVLVLSVTVTVRLKRGK